MKPPSLLASLVLACTLGAAGWDAIAALEKGNQVDARTYAVWQTLREMDCARCHGSDWNGSVGPSILAYVRSQSRESFVRIVLEGNPGQGMPGYRGVAGIADHIDEIYRYFKGVASGEIPAGKLELRK
jgi:mono/diheme cytochrome c family protein